MSEKCLESKLTTGEHYFVCHNHGLACHWCGETKDISPTSPDPLAQDEWNTETNLMPLETIASMYYKSVVISPKVGE